MEFKCSKIHGFLGGGTPREKIDAKRFGLVIRKRREKKIDSLFKAFSLVSFCGSAANFTCPLSVQGSQVNVLIRRLNSNNFEWEEVL